jgi:hypothetical protein
VLGPLALIAALVELAIGASPHSSFSEAVLYFMFVYAYPTAFLVGIPSYVLNRKRMDNSAAAIFILGGSVSSITWCFIILIWLIFVAFMPPSKTVDEIIMAFGFAATVIGTIIIPLILLGGASGVLFWKVAIPNVRRSGEVTQTADPGAAREGPTPRPQLAERSQHHATATHQNDT